VPTHLVAEQGVHRRVGVQRHRHQLDVGRLPHSCPHPPLHFQQLPRDAQMRRRQKPPEGTLGRQPQHPQDAGQHRLPFQKAQMMQPRKTDVSRQHPAQHELIQGHGPRDPLDRQRLFDQLLESEFLQHGRDG
jgi:hypothetical protein